MSSLDLKGLEEMRKNIDSELEELWELSSVISSLKNVIEYFNKQGLKVSVVAI